jgi:hypothetical protein
MSYDVRPHPAVAHLRAVTCSRRHLLVHSVRQPPAATGQAHKPRAGGSPEAQQVIGEGCDLGF